MRRALLGTLLLVAAARDFTPPTVSCPPGAFTTALRRLATHLRPNTVPRAGGLATLATHYRTRYASPCRPYNFPNQPHNASWPTSTLNTRKKLMLGLGEGTTGTRFLHCVARRLGLAALHDMQRPRRFTTRVFDGRALVLDSPVPYLVRPLLEAHVSTQLGTFLTVRDPWDWHRKRSKHKNNANWSAAGACKGRATKLGAPDAGVLVPRDLLVFFAWTLCATQERGLACPVLNLFDDRSPGQRASKTRFLGVLADAGHAFDAAALDRAWAACRA